MQNEIQKAFEIHRRGQFDVAHQAYLQLLQRYPDQPDVLHLLGLLCLQQGQRSDAVRLIGRAIEVGTGKAVYHFNLANALQACGRSEEAITHYDRALSLEPNHGAACNNKGLALQSLGRWTAALAALEQSMALNPSNLDAVSNHGNVLMDMGLPVQALESYRRAFDMRPEHPDVVVNLANALAATGQVKESLDVYDQAIALKPGHPQAYNNKGNALKQLGRNVQALASYSQALKIKPDYAEAFNNRGVLLRVLQKPQEAVEDYLRALHLSPLYPQAHNNLGNALHDLRCYSQALESFDRALSLNPGYAEAFNNKGNVLKDLKRLDEALACYEQALHLKPDYEYLPGMVLHMKMFMCQWDGYEQGLNSLLEGIEAGQKTTLSFPVLGLTDRADVQRQAAEILGRDKYPEQDALGPCLLRAGREKIRVGYFSADFHNHATAYLIAELFEQHDRSRFEVLGFSYGHMQQDEMRTRLLKGFDQFHEVRHLADIDIARLSRSLGVDIAVDLKGLTQDHRLGIFAYRAAPVQVSYLGYPGTTGVPYMDYVLADRVVIPEGSQGHYSEKVIYLPDSYQVNDSKRTIAQRVFSRSELGLPESGFVFCSFNNNYKITPQVFGCWMAMLKAVPGSVLWLLQDNPWAVENLRQQALRQGVAPERLVFAQRTSLAEHLARQRVADLFVDTFPCNAHTTASDALWAGLPLLTLAGESFASRVAASLLNAVGLPELVCGSLQEYQAQAVGLAQDGPRLKSIRTRLNEQLHNAPLFDARRFCQTLEENFLLLVKS